jgi:hypothetical protein
MRPISTFVLCDRDGELSGFLARPEGGTANIQTGGAVRRVGKVFDEVDDRSVGARDDAVL